MDNLACRNISSKDLIKLRQKINGLIILMLDYKLHLTQPKDSHIEKFTDYLINLRAQHRENDLFSIISTNWDILLDNSFRRKMPQAEGVVDYCFDTSSYDDKEPILPGLLALEKGLYNVKLLKLHGSMNWLQCKCCKRLLLLFLRKLRLMNTSISLSAGNVNTILKMN